MTRVLVAENDSSNRDLLRLILTRAGYEVIDVHDGDEALAVVARGEHVDLFLTDHRMPLRNGLDVIDAMRTVRPAMPCLLISGSPELEGSLELLGRRDVRFLRKPFAVRDLLAVAEDVLRSPAEQRPFGRPPEESPSAP